MTIFPDKKKLIIIELNELNFDLVGKCVSRGVFPAFSKIIKFSKETSSEEKYELLEPWIQWVSIRTGLSASQHGVFRLGDLLPSKFSQYYEKVEDMGFSVGAIAPINAVNRLKNPNYFIGDPWTDIVTDGSWWSKKISTTISELVRGNAVKKYSIFIYINFLIILLKFAKLENLHLYVIAILGILRKKKWYRALLLDLVLHDIHTYFLLSKPANLSTLFLNAGAHIQHHYLMSSIEGHGGSSAYSSGVEVNGDNPVRDCINFYEKILLQYLSMKDCDLVIATGLSQLPYDRVKYYYRLTNHSDFLGLIGVKFSRVRPLMSRDFWIDFDNPEYLKLATQLLAKITINNKVMFSEFCAQGSSLFVTLSYPDQINEEDLCVIDGSSFPVGKLVSFVAIKNGMHCGKGYIFASDGIFNLMEKEKSPDILPITSIFDLVIKYFDVKRKSGSYEKYNLQETKY